MSSRPVRCAKLSPRSLMAAGVPILLLAAGCTGFDKLRGDGLRESENWGQELREQHQSGTSYGGLTTKANQIERNLGVR